MKNLLLILVLTILSGCRTVIYTTDDVYYSHASTSGPLITNNRVVRPAPRPFINHITPRPKTKVIKVTPRRTNLETYRRTNRNPKHK